MKRLLILRHAKSSWGDEKIPDHERPLNKRGQRAAPAMGRLIRKDGLLPDLVLSSTALRCRQTVAAMIEASGYSGEVRWLADLYMAEAPAYIEALRSLPDDPAAVMVVGHNPGLEELLAVLTGGVEHLATGSLALVALPLEHWSELSETTRGELDGLWKPKELGKGI